MNTWQQKLLDVLTALGLVRRPQYRLFHQVAHPSPQQVTSDAIIVTQAGRVEKVATFRCPGPCSRRILLNLNPARTPNWRIESDWLGRPSITPSVRQPSDCRCHFWIITGAVHWCEDTPVNSPAQRHWIA